LEVRFMRRNGTELPDETLGSPAAQDPPPPVTRITVSLIEKAAAALARLIIRTRLSQTDIVNRALILYEFVDSETSSGAEVIVRRDGKEHHVVLL
jgi:hypothetical protein